MKSWQQFRESKESEEEKNGLDLDHDNERGEPSEHKAKVKAAKQEMLDFFQKRKEGAKKIAREAAAKGGPSQLTEVHFKAKDRPYYEVLTAIRENKPESYYLSKCKNLITKLHFGKMTQEAFQKTMGEIEVYGEAMAKLFSNK